jgi:hypothetical protein
MVIAVQAEHDSKVKPNSISRLKPESVWPITEFFSTSTRNTRFGEGRWTLLDKDSLEERDGLLPCQENAPAKDKEVMRLRDELDVDQCQVARSGSILVSTVHENRPLRALGVRFH